MAPVARAAILVSALYTNDQRRHRWAAERTYGLIVFTARPRDHICRTRLGSADAGLAISRHLRGIVRRRRYHVLLCLFRSTRRRIDHLLAETHEAADHAADVALEVADAGGHEPLARFGEEVGFFDFAFGRVDVGEVEGAAPRWVALAFVTHSGAGHRAYLAE